MKAYSLDLRQRVVSAYEAGETTIQEVAGRFSVGATFVKKMLRQKRLHGSVEPPARGGGKPRALTAKHLKALQRWLREEPDLTLRELQQKMWSEQGKQVSPATLGKVLAEEKLTRKKSLSWRRSGITENAPVIGGA